MARPRFDQQDTVRRLNGMTAPLPQVNQERRQRAALGRSPVASDPQVSNAMMAALPTPNTRATAPRGSNPTYSPQALRGLNSGLKTAQAMTGAPQINYAALDKDMGRGGALRQRATAENGAMNPERAAQQNFTHPGGLIGSAAEALTKPIENYVQQNFTNQHGLLGSAQDRAGNAAWKAAGVDLQAMPSPFAATAAPGEQAGGDPVKEPMSPIQFSRLQNREQQRRIAEGQTTPSAVEAMKTMQAGMPASTQSPVQAMQALKPPEPPKQNPQEQPRPSLGFPINQAQAGTFPVNQANPETFPVNRAQAAKTGVQTPPVSQKQFGPSNAPDAFMTPEGDTVQRLPQSRLTKKSIYKNVLTNPADRAQYGNAIYSDSAGGATKRGLDQAIAANGQGVDGASFGAGQLPATQFATNALVQGTASGRANQAGQLRDQEMQGLRAWAQQPDTMNRAPLPDWGADRLGLPRQGEDYAAQQQRLAAPAQEALKHQRALELEQAKGSNRKGGDGDAAKYFSGAFKAAKDALGDEAEPDKLSALNEALPQAQQIAQQLGVDLPAEVVGGIAADAVRNEAPMDAGWTPAIRDVEMRRNREKRAAYIQSLMQTMQQNTQGLAPPP